MYHIKHHFSGITKNKRLKTALAFLLFLGAFYSLSVFAADELATVMASAKENFGADSSFLKLMYGAEVIAGGYAWHKTKHPSAVIGIVVLAMFMTFALGHFVFK